MQDSLFHAVQIDETTRSSFAAFQQNPLERFKWNVRRTRAAQLRELLSNPDAINLQTFLREVWSIESETCLRSRDRELRIFESTVLAQSIEQLLSENTVTLEELEKALDSGDLEFHGNYIWRQGSKGYDIRPSKTDQQRLEQIHQALSILNRPDLPLNKAVQIEAIPGFDEENATGLVMIFHPNEFALVNAVSRGILKRLGVNHTASTPQQVIQNELRYLKKALGATDFLELDWFLYQCIQDEYPLVAVESAIGGRANGTCLQAIIKVLEEAGEPLHYEERIVTIQPAKMSPTAYQQLLEDLEMRLPASIILGLQRNGAFTGIQIRPPGESTLAMELTSLSRAINGDAKRMGLIQVLSALASDPHTTLASTELWIPRERARQPHPSRLIQAMARPCNVDKQGVPIHLFDTRVEHSIDVYENRLVKVYMHQAYLRLHRLKRIVENKPDNTLINEVQKLFAALNIAKRNAAFLENVTLPSSLPMQCTMVILKRPAYHAALQGYLEFHRNPGVYLEEPALESPLENLPFLYQVWGTLEVIRVLLDIAGSLGYEIRLQRLAKMAKDGIFIQLLPNGESALILEHPGTGTMVKVIPQRAYTNCGELRSISFLQRPDIAIEISLPQRVSSIYLFDPKYKVGSGGLEDSTPKKEDIDKMHAYRDAIRDSQQRRVVQYAAILYPGQSQTYGDGIEALQALPGRGVSLEEQLRAIFAQALRM